MEREGLNYVNSSRKRRNPRGEKTLVPPRALASRECLATSKFGRAEPGPLAMAYWWGRLALGACCRRERIEESEEGDSPARIITNPHFGGSPRRIGVDDGISLSLPQLSNRTRIMLRECAAFCQHLRGRNDQNAS